ncbi:MAG: 16S rRNA (cytosine(1402)-N(4))-methyltransferase RsmH [Bacteroidia bacterium]|nr:16S rRNA (cytosine(1402)-N(4))-methyltransferase RsmH [Bacteroidia bacterium]
MSYHTPVLLKESVDLLAIKPGGVYVDVTHGGGGHTGEILKRLGENGQLIAFDKDKDAAGEVAKDQRLRFFAADFKFIETVLSNAGIGSVDGILADLGISSHQIDTPERGFSYRFEAPLDMRMDTTQPLTAADILNETDEPELVSIFSRYGEVPNSRKLARTIVGGRKRAPLSTTRQFETLIESCIPAQRKSKYLAQVYQSLRIVVNHEMEALENLLLASLKILRPGGRIVVIAYHSLEDRMVKNFFRAGNLSGKEEKDFYGRSLTPWKKITRSAIQASEAEITANPRARSARLRAVEKEMVQS